MIRVGRWYVCVITTLILRQIEYRLSTLGHGTSKAHSSTKQPQLCYVARCPALEAVVTAIKPWEYLMAMMTPAKPSQRGQECSRDLAWQPW